MHSEPYTPFLVAELNVHFGQAQQPQLRILCAILSLKSAKLYRCSLQHTAGMVCQWFVASEKKECLSLSQFNCQTTSFDVQSKFQIFPSHSIFLVRNFPPFRVLLLVLCVCVCVSAFFSGHKLL